MKLILLYKKEDALKHATVYHGTKRHPASFADGASMTTAGRARIQKRITRALAEAMTDPVATDPVKSAHFRRKKARPVKRAQTLTDTQFAHLRTLIRTQSHLPEIDELLLLLSFYAGLRASEMAALDMAAVTGPDGSLSHSIWISGAIAKNGRDRQIPMHPEIRNALMRFRARFPGLRWLAPRRTNFRGPTTANALAAWFKRFYRSAGFENCSSHSGRRTCLTNLAQRANHFHNSLRDVQLIAGHARLETTSSYIAPSDDVSAMIASLGGAPSSSLELQHSP